MAKLSFPTSPSVNDIYTQDGISYQWDGSKWTANNDTALNLDAILANGSSTTKTLTTGAITSPTAAKAWVNFDGTTNVIRGSYNVSSITDTGTGIYSINFTNAMSDTNYTFVGQMGFPDGVTTSLLNVELLSNTAISSTMTTTSLAIETVYRDAGINRTRFDGSFVGITVFGN